MTKGTIFGGVFILIALAAGFLAYKQQAGPTPETPPAIESSITHSAPETDPGFLYGRITTIKGATFQGRLRWGGDEEAFWGDYFNGTRSENRWAAYVPAGRLKESYPVELFGVQVARREREIDLDRPFMTRFGDIAQIEARGVNVGVTLKSGTTIDLDRLEAGDFDDGVRVWDGGHGIVDLDSLQIRKIEFLPTPLLDAAPYRLHGTVRTGQGEFSGFIQWNREKCVGSDELNGLRFDAIRSIDRTVVTLLDGREIALDGRIDRGIYVDDRRYGRVLISWDAFQRIDFTSGGSGPAYGDFPAFGPIMGSVTTRTGDTFVGRLVYDLDESETVETLDAPYLGVDYTIPFSMIASIMPPGREPLARLTLHSGEELQLEAAGDLGQGNAGILIFTDGQELPEYVPWSDVEQVDFDRRSARHPQP